VDLEGLKSRARARAASLSAGHVEDPGFQRDVLAFFQRVPEPPVYRRRDDPVRAQAKELLEMAEGLLARAWAGGAEWAAFAEAVEAHCETLGHLADGRVEAAEPAWHAAQATERRATAALKLWSRTDEARPAVYDPATGRSRFDPRPESMVEARLPCPGCRKVSQFTLSPRVAMHQLACTHCARSFSAYVAELRTLEVEATGRSRRRYHFRVAELSGLATVIDFDDASRGELSAAPRDLLAFLYQPANDLRGVLNLETSRVLWLTAPACFVATVAFEDADAPELDVLRRFRDDVLSRTMTGRAFTTWYYRHGPALAAVVAPRPRLKAVTRRALSGVVAWLERRP
jgi:hypothetical protein